jgi:hypothetical protein
MLLGEWVYILVYMVNTQHIILLMKMAMSEWVYTFYIVYTKTIIISVRTAMGDWVYILQGEYSEWHPAYWMVMRERAYNYTFIGRLMSECVYIHRLNSQTITRLWGWGRVNEFTFYRPNTLSSCSWRR